MFGVPCGRGDVSFSVFSRLVVGGDGIFVVCYRRGDACFSMFLG
jgi:hypothetical protein